MRLRPLLRKLRSEFLGWVRILAITVVPIGLAAGTAWAAYTEAWPAMVSHSYFRLRSVKVVCDSGAAEPSALAARAGLYDGTSLWQIDPDHGKAALTSVPWVREARIHRRFPDEVSVEVYRREAVAATVADGGPFLIDGDGVIYREGDAVPYPDLPYLTGWEQGASRGDRVAKLRTSMALVRAVEAVGIEVSQVDVDAEGVVRLYPEGRRIVVVLGREPQPASDARRLETVWKALPERAEDLREIDLSYPDRAVLRTNPGRVRSVISAMAGPANRGLAVNGPAKDEGRGDASAQTREPAGAPEDSGRG